MHATVGRLCFCDHAGDWRRSNMKNFVWVVELRGDNRLCSWCIVEHGIFTDKSSAMYFARNLRERFPENKFRVVRLCQWDKVMSDCKTCKWFKPYTDIDTLASGMKGRCDFPLPVWLNEHLFWFRSGGNILSVRKTVSDCATYEEIKS